MAIGGYEMDLPKPSLAEICLQICDHINNLGAVPPNDVDSSWAQVEVITGAPGANLIDANLSTNTLNLFFYRFKPAGFNAGAGTGDIHWMKVFCIITAFGFDESEDKNLAGINELRMLSEVMRLFQEEPIKIFRDINDKDWHVQFIPKPLADEQINQIWSTQGSVIYRPSVVYEIALAPIEPKKPAIQPIRVASIGTVVGSGVNNRDSSSSDTQPDFHFPLVPTISVDISNPQWAPIIVILTEENNKRQASLNLNLKLNEPNFNNFPSIDLFIAGDDSKKIRIVGQLLQSSINNTNPSQWQDVTPIENINADVQKININQLPLTVDTHLDKDKLNQWTNSNSTNDSFKLQLFAERKVMINEVAFFIRSNPILINITRKPE